MKKHILVVSQYFYPEQFRINDIVKEWNQDTYKVTVLTGVPNYPEGKFYKGYGLFQKNSESYEGIDVIRLPIFPRQNNPLSLSLNYLSFVFSGFIWKTITKLKPDLVFIYEVSPMTQALPGVWISKKLNIPCYIYVTDLWPENVEILTNIKNKFFLNGIGKMVDYIYKNAKYIFTSSESFISSIVSRGVDREKVKFWPQYAEDFYKPIDPNSIYFTNEIPQDERLNITFAGNIGYSQGLDILPEVAKLLKREKIKVRFNVIGDGRYKKTFVDEVNNLDVDSYFNFIDRKAPEEIPNYFAFSDIALVSLKKNKVFSITIPAKVQSCLACGMPLLVSGDGEVQKIVEDSSAGLFSDAEDSLGLFDNIRKFSNMTEEEIEKMSLNARQYYLNKFEKRKLLEKMDEFLKAN